MNKKQCIIILSLLLISNLLSSQQIDSRVEDDLTGMFIRLRENRSVEEKLAINDSVKFIIEKYASADSVFRHRFSNLRFLGQICSSDSLVKIITWNLILEDGVNRYYCYMIRRNMKAGKNIIYKLYGFYNEAPIKTDTIYSESNWYGALYYDIRPFGTGSTSSYTVLGIDYGNSFITRKIIDVVTFISDEKLEFGKMCFIDGKSVHPRVVFEFAATAVMSLKFDSDRSVVFDHLSPFSPDLKDNRQFYGPDFSYDSYNLENGFWRLKSDIDVRIKGK